MPYDEQFWTSMDQPRGEPGPPPESHPGAPGGPLAPGGPATAAPQHPGAPAPPYPAPPPPYPGAPQYAGAPAAHYPGAPAAQYPGAPAAQYPGGPPYDASGWSTQMPPAPPMQPDGDYVPQRGYGPAPSYGGSGRPTPYDSGLTPDQFPMPMPSSGIRYTGGALVLAVAGLIGVCFFAWVFHSMGSDVKSSRETVFDIMARVELESVALAEEAYLAQHSRYGTLEEVTRHASMTRTPGVEVRIVRADAKGICLSGKHDNSDNTYYYDSQRGMLDLGVTCG